MLSILIPTYNYNVFPLVNEIHKQFSKLEIPFEIRVYEDGSDIDFETRKFLEDFDRVYYKKFNKRQGRTKMRHLLAEEAKYPRLLFLDADVFPKNRFFAAKLIKELENFPSQVYFGGITVAPSPPSPSKILRWKYGKERESLPLEIRKKHPYKSLISGALLIEKNTFLPVSNKIKDLNKYGLDIYFSYLLKQEKAKVRHYDNPVMHLGLEDSEVFLKKTEKAVETLYFLIKTKKIPVNYSKLGEKYNQIKKAGLCGLSRFFYKIFKKACYKNLLSNHPSLYIFDLYKLCYFCTISKK